MPMAICFCMVHDIDLLCSIRLFIQLVNAGTYIVVQQYCIILIPLLAHHGCTYLAKPHTMPPTGAVRMKRPGMPSADNSSLSTTKAEL